MAATNSKSRYSGSVQYSGFLSTFRQNFKSEKLLPRNQNHDQEYPLIIWLQIFQDVSSKTVGLTREASALLNGSTSASAQLGSHLSSHAELLSSKAEPPLVWFTTSIFANQRLSESLRFGMLEIQEHLETFLDRKDHATEVLQTSPRSRIKC